MFGDNFGNVSGFNKFETLTLTTLISQASNQASDSGAFSKYCSLVSFYYDYDENELV
jgi:hypothetical protein